MRRLGYPIPELALVAVVIVGLILSLVLPLFR